MFGLLSKSIAKHRSKTRFDSESKPFLTERPVLVWMTDAILVTLILVFPFVMGGREAWGHRLLITLATALGFVWCLHRARTGGRLVLLSLEPLLLAGLFLVWFQTLPLSQTALSTLSGEYERLLPAWSQTQPGQPENAHWNTASFYPAETQHGLTMLLAYGIIGCVLAQRLSSEQDCYRLLKLIGISGLLMATFAVLQLIASNDRFFWFYRHPYTGTREVLKGAFTNRNHFAQFLSLAIGPLIWWMLIDRSPSESHSDLRRKTLDAAYGNHSHFGKIVDPRMLLLLCATGGILLTIMLSLSRGGMISAGIACIVCLAGLWKSGRVKASLACAILALGVIAIGGLAIFGQDRVEDRIGQLASGDADQIDRLNARRSIWKADLSAIRAFPLLGTGVGTHRFVYPLYMQDLASFPGVTFSHAESTYINLALETGLCGLAMLVIGVSSVVAGMSWHLLRLTDSTRSAAVAAILASVAGGAVHAAVDFIWYAPAIVVTTIMLVVVGMRLCSGFRPGRGLYMPRIAWFALGSLCLLALCQSQPELSQRVAGQRLWYQYLIAEFDASGDKNHGLDSDADLLELGLETDNLNPLPVSVDATDGKIATSDHAHLTASESELDLQKFRSRVASIRQRMELLMASLKANPNQAEVRQHLAMRSLDLFELLQTQSENRLPLTQIRDVVATSEFASTQAMYAFLKRAFGQNIRLVLMSDQWSRQALKLCPLTERSFETLVSTNFVRDPEDRLHNAMIAQALLIGTNSPRTRHSIGLILLAEGRQSEAFRELGKAFHASRALRLSICGALGKTQSVDLILNQFAPSPSELRDVLASYLEFGRPVDIGKVAWKIADSVRETVQSSSSPVDTEHYAELLMEAYRAAYGFRFHEQCEDLLRLAIECDATAEPPRRALGLLMLEQKNYAEAEEHFAWCNEQFPGDAKLEELRRECRRLEMIQSRQVMPASYQVPQ
jgi:tetratricopeptide (TPR) repeat protein